MLLWTNTATHRGLWSLVGNVCRRQIDGDIFTCRQTWRLRPRWTVYLFIAKTLLSNPATTSCIRYSKIPNIHLKKVMGNLLSCFTLLLRQNQHFILSYTSRLWRSFTPPTSYRACGTRFSCLWHSVYCACGSATSAVGASFALRSSRCLRSAVS